MSLIHPTAIIEPGVKLGKNVSVGPYSVIGKDIEIGENSVILNSATLHGPAKIGKRTKIFPYSVIGGDSQDKKFDPSKHPGRLEIGDDCVFREYTTINRGSSGEDSKTSIGNRCHLLAYCHVAHDCILEDDVTFSNGVTLAGHVKIGQNVTAGGFVAVHQFSEIGDYCMLSSKSLIKSSIPHFLLVSGLDDAKAITINKIGLDRAGFSEDDIKLIEQIFKLFYRDKNMVRAQAVEEIKKRFGHEKIARSFVEFVQTRKNICSSNRH